MNKIVLIALCYFSGCEHHEQEPPTRWRVEMVRPDGRVHKSWVVSSRLRPKIYPLWGGQIELYQDNGNQQYESFGLIAPVGWAFDSERLKAK